MSTLVVKASSGRTRLLVGLAGTLSALAAWLVLSRESENVYFPALTAILAETWEYWRTPEGIDNLTASLSTLSLGLILGVLAGATIGLVIGQLTIVEQSVSPVLEFARAIPATALIPFAMMLFGIGDQMKIFLIALGSLWPVLLNTADGARRIDPTLQDSARAFRITGFQRQVFIVLPAVLPRVLLGVRIAIPLALILMVTSEMVGAQEGLGFVITQAQATFKLVTMWSGIVVLGVLGFLLTFLYSLLERVLLRWSDPRREDA